MESAAITTPDAPSTTQQPNEFAQYLQQFFDEMELFERSEDVGHRNEIPRGLFHAGSCLAFVFVRTAGNFPPEWSHLLPAAERFCRGMLELIRVDDVELDRLDVPRSVLLQPAGELRKAFEDGPPRTGIEPVSELLEQLKDSDLRFQQVATIYGRWDSELERYTGPFFTANGQVDHGLIHSEAQNPGSVVPPGYDPRNSKISAERAAAAAQIGVLLGEYKQHFEARLRASGKAVGDKATVEQLLREGQFPDVIASVKGISEISVRMEARRLGIRIVERDALLNAKGKELWRSQNQLDQPYQDGIGGPSAVLPESSGEQQLDRQPASQGNETADVPAAPSPLDGNPAAGQADELKPMSGEALDTFIREQLEADDQICVSGILGKLREQGQVVSPLAIGRKLAALKRGL